MKKIWRAPVVFILLVLFALASCGGDKGHDNGHQSISFTGTVKFFTLEGGFYAIAGDNGTNYDPTNLPPEYNVDGLRLHVDALVREDLVSAHMIGPIIEITSIQPL